MKGYTGQVTAAGKPVLAVHGKTYQIPQRGISSSLKPSSLSSTSANAQTGRWSAEQKAKTSRVLSLLAKGLAAGSVASAASAGSSPPPPPSPGSPHAGGGAGPPSGGHASTLTEKFNEAARPDEAAAAQARHREEEQRRIAKLKAEKIAEETKAETRARTLKSKQEEEHQRVAKEEEEKRKKEEARKEEQRRRLTARSGGQSSIGMSGAAANMSHDFKRSGGKLPPDHPDAHRLPHDSAKRAREIVLEKQTMFVRVHVKGKQKSSWIMRPEDLYDSNGKQLTAQQLKDKFALPELPTHVSDVHVPASTRLRVGTVARQKDWGEGGAIHYELKYRLPDSAFQNQRELK